MKILSLTFSNLNSLKGAWHIDFTNDAFVNDGIFAITGQTGAGKTTILDAICLAIYGQTPRISVISNSHNELMSIDRGECHSEVVVLIHGSAGEQIYRFSFEQRRASKKADGKLQPIKRQISRLKHLNDEGVIIETKPSLCDKKAIELMHMNFEQFTRSVMLAQGNFSAFLKAEANEKGEILEQITGTEIYAKISQKAFEVHKQKKEELQQLESTLHSHNSINHDDFLQLESLMHRNQELIDVNKHTLTQLEKNIHLVQDKKKAEDAIVHYQAIINQHQEKMTAFHAKAQLLHRANQAHVLETSYQELAREQLVLNTTKQTIHALKETLPDLTQKLQALKQQSDKAQHTLHVYKQQYQESLPLFKQIRDLDNQLIHDKSLLDKLHQDITHQQTLMNDSKEKISELTTRQTASSQALEMLNNSTLQTDMYTNIKQDLGILSGLSQQLNDAISQLSQNEVRLYHEKQDVDNKNKLIDEKRQYLKHKKEILGEYEQQKQQLNQEIANLLASPHTKKPEINIHTLNECNMDFQDKRHRIHELMSLFNELEKHHETYQRITTELNDCITKHTALLQEKNTLAHHISQINEHLTSERQTLSVLEQNYHLQQELFILKQHHAKLTHNEPCPLCGALEHPYAKTHPILHEMDENISLAIHHSSETIDKLSHTLQQHKDDLAVIHGALPHHESQIAQLHQQQNELMTLMKNSHQHLIHHKLLTPDDGTRQANAVDVIYLNDDLSNARDCFTQLSTTLQRTLHQHQQRQTDFKAQLSLWQNTDEHITQLNQEITHITQDGIALKSEIDLVSASINTLTHNGEQIQAHIKHSICMINDKLNYYGQSLINQDDNPAHISRLVNERIDELTRMSEAHDHRQTQKQQLETQLSHLIIHLENEHLKQNQYLQAFTELSEQYHDQQTAHQAKQQTRLQLFADKDVEAEESLLRQHMEHQQDLINTLQTAQQEEERTHHALNEQINYHETQLTQLMAQVEQLEHDFSQSLQRHTFTHLDDFLSARLADDVRLHLQQEEDALLYELKQAQDNHQLWQDNLHQLLSDHQDIHTLDLAALIAQKEDLQNTHDELLTTSGEQRQKYLDAKLALEKQQTLIDLIHDKKQDLLVWAKLDELIGSKEGMKYRNFAQGLTLELMLHHANHVLAQMDNRYVLTHDDKANKSLLDISVIDTAQGSEVRSTKNLSGGESFIISLALAMGLSQMSSENISIDSLFLDEGFGTLDDEVLDIALSVLSSLKDTGKMIGIISHVQSLKERIPTQIHIKKIANGESILLGSGVSSP